MTDFKTLLQAFDQLLQPERFKDYGPNGLQVEGRAEVRRIVSGVTASLELLEAAIADKADATLGSAWGVSPADGTAVFQKGAKR